jgi:transposase-like protein
LESGFLQKLADKKITKEAFYKAVTANFDLPPEVFTGLSSPKASVRYGCAGVLVDLTAKYPESLYPFVDKLVTLLDSKHQILTWNAMTALANLCRVDKDEKFDAIFSKYFWFLDNEYLVTVANVVGNSGKIAVAKPYLVPKITQALLKIEGIKTTKHLTEECKKVIAEKTLDSFSQFIEKMNAQDKLSVLAFASRCLNSSRSSLKKKAEAFLKKWSWEDENQAAEYHDSGLLEF